MLYGYRPQARSLSRAGLGLVLLVLFVVPAFLPGQARAQEAFTPTPTKNIPGHSRPKATLVAPPIQITRSAPTFVVTDARIFNLETTALSSRTKETSADLAFEDQFKATINVTSPSSMQMGESRVITLEVIPELLAQASMVRADLLAIKFDSLDDGHPEKTVLVNTPVRWNWNIAPKEPGEHEFFLVLSYVNSQGSRVHWQNLILEITVNQAATPTGILTAASLSTQTSTAFDTPTIAVDTHTPTLEPATPTWMPSSTNTPAETPVSTLTPTFTLFKRVSNDASENPAPYLGMVVTFVLGLLSVYFQYVRKKEK